MINENDKVDTVWDQVDNAIENQDMPRVLKLWEQLADLGVSSLYSHIGEFYETGRVGVEVNLPEAVVWYQKSIKLCDDPNAHSGLGRILYKGDGVKRDVNKALYHWLKAYEKNDKNAALYLGIAYYHHSQNIPKSKRYLEEAKNNKYFYAYGKLARIAIDEFKFFKACKLLVEGYLLAMKLSKKNPLDERLLGIE